jgi:peptidoglycan hydrolase FlgJ
MSSLPTAGLAGDAQSLAGLRARANADPKTAVREVAKQFEALFMQELMKSMRAATLSSGMLENEGSKLGTDLLDQQFATQMTGLPGGLSEAITRQLERQMGMAPGPIPVPAPNLPVLPERPARCNPAAKLPASCPCASTGW